MSSIRIEQCHSIQEQSLNTLERVTAVLSEYTGLQLGRDTLLHSMNLSLRDIEQQLTLLASKAPKDS